MPGPERGLDLRGLLPAGVVMITRTFTPRVCNARGYAADLHAVGRSWFGCVVTTRLHVVVYVYAPVTLPFDLLWIAVAFGLVYPHRLAMPAVACPALVCGLGTRLRSAVPFSSYRTTFDLPLPHTPTRGCGFAGCSTQFFHTRGFPPPRCSAYTLVCGYGYYRTCTVPCGCSAWFAFPLWFRTV